MGRSPGFTTATATTVCGGLQVTYRATVWMHAEGNRERITRNVAVEDRWMFLGADPSTGRAWNLNNQVTALAINARVTVLRHAGNDWVYVQRHSDNVTGWVRSSALQIYVPVTGIEICAVDHGPPRDIGLNSQWTWWPRVLPGNATNRNITWSIADGRIARQDGPNLFGSGNWHGFTTVTAQTHNGFWAQYWLSVWIPVTGNRERIANFSNSMYRSANNGFGTPNRVRTAQNQLAMVFQGERVTAYRQANDWVYVRRHRDNLTGWVWAPTFREYVPVVVQPPPPPPPPPPPTFVPRDGWTSGQPTVIRSGPGYGFSEVTRHNPGVQLRIVGESGNWWHLSCGNWVSKNWVSLSFVAAPGGTQTQPAQTPTTRPSQRFFWSADDAALAWAEYYFSTSLFVRHEHGAMIYRGVLGMYSVTATDSGWPHTMSYLLSASDVPPGTTAIGAVHTHPNSTTEFSVGDREWALTNGGSIYVAAPTTLLGTTFHLRRYDVPTTTRAARDVFVGVVSLRGLNILERHVLSGDTRPYRSQWERHLPCSRGGFTEPRVYNICNDVDWPTPGIPFG